MRCSGRRQQSRGGLGNGPVQETLQMTTNPHLTGYVQFATQAWHEMRRLIRTTEPESQERYALIERILPRYQNVAQSRLTRCLAEAKQAGRLAVLDPKLTALDCALRDAVDAFLTWPQGTGPVEPSPLIEAILTLQPYATIATEKVEDGRFPNHLKRGLTTEAMSWYLTNTLKGPVPVSRDDAVSWCVNRGVDRFTRKQWADIGGEPVGKGKPGNVRVYDAHDLFVAVFNENERFEQADWVREQKEERNAAIRANKSRDLR